jgi:hypothetical protein
MPNVITFAAAIASELEEVIVVFACLNAIDILENAAYLKADFYHF